MTGAISAMRECGGALTRRTMALWRKIYAPMKKNKRAAAAIRRVSSLQSIAACGRRATRSMGKACRQLAERMANISSGARLGGM